MRQSRMLISLLLLVGLVALACGGGSNPDPGPPDSDDIPTATPPNPLPEVIIVGQVTVTPSGETYVVQPGDSPSSIAEQFGVSVEELMAVNGITDPTALFAGQELIIPGAQASAEGVPAATNEPPPTDEPPPTEEPSFPTATPDVEPEPTAGAGGQVYVVAEGDIPETIAAQFGITAQELMDANGITDPSSLNIGDELIIPAPAEE